MRSKFSVLLMLILLLTSVNAWCGLNFGPGVEADTSNYFTIQNFFLSPFQLTEYNFLGGGGRARGMGGAFFAISDDPSAASWNPAGLSQIEKPQMLLTFRSYMRRSDFTSTANGLDFTYSDKLKRDNNAISFASVAIPFNIRGKELVGSVLFQKLADIYKANKYYLIVDSTKFIDQQGDTNTIYNYPLDPIIENISGSLNSVNVSFAAKIYKSLSLGLGVNVYGGNFVSDADFFYPVGDTSGLTGYRYRPHIKSNYSGVNATMGAMYKFDKLSLGAVVKTPFNLKEENDLKLYTDIIESGVVLEFPSILASPFFKTDRKWKMPLMIGVGGAYQLKALTLSADMEYRGYSKTEVTYRRNIANPTGDEVTTGGYVTDKWWGTEGENPPFVSSLEWRNVTQFRIGGEYMLNTKFGKIPLRLGYRNDPQPFAASVNPSEVYLRLDQYVSSGDTGYTPALLQSNNGTTQGSWVNGNIISVGTGIAWTQIKLDFTLEYATYPDVDKETNTAWYTFDRGNKKLLYEIYKHTFTSNETSIHYTRLMISFTGFF
jgi:long-subunit fatty acid transport protein